MAEKSIRPEKVLRIIGLSLFGVAILLAFIGCFGDIACRTITEITGNEGQIQTVTTITTQPFTYLFKDMWKNLDSIKTVAIYKDSYSFMLILSVLSILTYIGCLGGVLTILIVGLVKFVGKPGTDGVDVSKFTHLLLISVVPFLLTTALYYSAYGHSESRANFTDYYYNYTSTTSFGWGTVLMIVALFIAVVSSAFASIKDSIRKDEIIHKILTKVSMTILVFIIIFGFTNVGSITAQLEMETFNTNYGLLGLIRECFYRSYNPETGAYNIYPEARTFATLAFVFTLANACALILAFKSKKLPAKITFFASMIGFSIMSGVFAQIALEKIAPLFGITNISVSFASGPLVTAILSGIALIITCVSTKFATPEKEKATPKKAVESKPVKKK